MGAYVGWTIAAMLVLVGFVLLLFVPGIGILAAVALAIGLVMAAILAISYGGSRAASTSDVEERRREHVERQRTRGRRGRHRAR